jgi:succinate dehydrogenase hydrophobic anchor subunit
MSANNTRLWTWHIFSGLIILVLLGMHMVGMHLNDVLHLESFNPAGENPIAWANVVARAREIGTVVVYILLLATALYHGFYGLRNILLELSPSEIMTGFINKFLLVAGIVLFVFGSWAAIASFNLARTLG